MLETWEAESSPSQRVRVGGREDRRGLATPARFPTPGSANRSAPLGTSAFSLSGSRAQPTAARRGPRAPPPFSRSPSPSSPPGTMTGPEQRLSRVSLAAAAPAPGEGEQPGERSPEPGLTARRRQAGRTGYRTRGRRPGAQLALSVDQSEDARRAAAAATNSRGSGDAAGAGCPASPGVRLRG